MYPSGPQETWTLDRKGVQLRAGDVRAGPLKFQTQGVDSGDTRRFMSHKSSQTLPCPVFVSSC